MAIDTFIPEAWGARLRSRVQAKLVYAQPQIMNRFWEGEIKRRGDTVHILRAGTGATVKTYVRNTDIASPERPDGDELLLVVDQQKYTNEAIDDVDAVQADPRLWSGWLEATALNWAKAYDAYAASLLVAGAAAGNAVGSDATPVTVKATGTPNYTPYQFFVECRRQLQQVDAPEENRWAIINEDIEAELLNDPKYIAIGSGETRTGLIGRIAGFNILSTTRTPASPGSGGTPQANHKVVFGAGNEALTWADQITKTEAYRPEKQFGDAVKMLSVYGAKIVEPGLIGVAHVKD